MVIGTSRNMVIVGEPAVSWLCLNNIWLGWGMLFNVGYYDLIFYTYFISLVIPIWVFIMVGLNLWGRRGLIVKLEREKY